MFPKRAILLLSLLPLCIDAQASRVLHFGTYATDKATQVVRQFRPLLNKVEYQLSQQLGEPVKIRLHVSRNHHEGLKALQLKQVHFARLGPASYVEAKQTDAELQIIVVEKYQHQAWQHGVICVRSTSSINELLDLPGRSFAFGDYNSAIGRYLVQHLLLKQNIYADTLSSYNYLGRHDRVGSAIASGLYDAGALKQSTYAKLLKKGLPLRVIADIPSPPKAWVASDNLDIETLFLLRLILLNLEKDFPGVAQLENQGFREGMDSEYDSIRRAMQINHLFFQN